MPAKSSKPTSKKSAGKVKDLGASKDPRGGAQKKEGQAQGVGRGRSNLGSGKRYLA